MAKKDIATTDVSHRASSELDTVLRKTAPVNEVARVTVDEALERPRLFQTKSTRNATRVLFISQDATLLNPTTQSLDGFLNARDLFDEVHILLLRKGIIPKDPVLRVAENVWIYTAAAKSRLLLAHAGISLINEQLVFASGFRADLIVARDPFESALVAIHLGKKYKRPTQVHVLEDYTTKEFLSAVKQNKWRRYIPRWTLPRVASVRTATTSLHDLIKMHFKIPDLATLPRFQNYEALIANALSVNLKEKYTPFIFFLLFIGKLDHNSTLHKAIDAARFVLRNPRVGLLVLGNGPSVGEFQKRTKLLGIEKQVVFEQKVTDVLPYLKSANLLVATDTDASSDEILLQAAVSGIPMVLADTPFRSDIFTHKESAYLCPKDDIQAFTDSINDLLNNVGIRKVMADAAKDIVLTRFHQDPAQYAHTYRASIEQALFVDQQPSTDA
jgi:glycosyltransferase involved in cell wall biosynthesis